MMWPMVRIHHGTPFNKYAVVVQLVRIPACHAGGREFESRPPRHFVGWALSSVGRALPLQGRCHWFESSSAHHLFNNLVIEESDPFV